MRQSVKTAHSCGIRVGSSHGPNIPDAISEIKSQIGDGELQHLVVLFATSYDADEICRVLNEAFPGIPFTGCTTAGEIAPRGLSNDGMVIIAFPKDGFRIVAEVIEGAEQFSVEHVTSTVRKMRSKIANGHGHQLSERVFALLLVDGLSNHEEVLIASIDWALGDMQLIGGSAGDALSFERTTLLHDGRTFNNAAVLLMVDSEYPFKAFKAQNFEPTETKLVVTAADTENRIVHELNAEIAAHEYARVIGLMPEELGPFSFASYPLVVKVGDEHYCRSIRNMNEDGSLSFFCAIDEGIVLTVAHPHDMIASTENVLSEIDDSLGGIEVVLGFDCVLRRLDAENRQIRHHLEDLYKRYKVIGFHTYGEQYNAMHLNQTLTGIAFGSPQRNN